MSGPTTVTQTPNNLLLTQLKNGAFSLDVYCYSQTSGSAAPSPSALPLGAYIAVAPGDANGNPWTGVTWNSSWGIKLTQDPQDTNHYYFTYPVVEGLPNPIYFAMQYIDPAGQNYPVYNGNAASGEPLPFWNTLSYTIGTQNGQVVGQAGDVGAGGTTPTVVSVPADAFSFPVKPALSPIQWIHDTIWNALGSV